MNLTVDTPWPTRPFWSLARRVDRPGHQDEKLLSVYRELGVVPKSSRNDNFNRASEDLSTYKLVNAGDLVLNKMKTWQGSLAVSEYRGIVSPAYFVCELSSLVHARFLHHLLRSGPFIAMYLAMSKGIRNNQWDLPYDSLRNLQVPLPHMGDQRRIAEFLDDRVSRIDRIIAARREQQKLLVLGVRSEREKLLRSAPDRVRASRFVRVLPGFAFQSSGFTSNSNDTPLLRGINVGVGRIDWSHTVYWPRDGGTEMAAFRLTAGDVVMGMDRPWITQGMRIATVGPEDNSPLLLQRVAKLVPLNGLDADFMRCAYESDQFREQVESTLTGLSVPHLSADQIGAFVMPWGDSSWQLRVAHQVADYRRDAVVRQSTLTRSIDLLTEYKQSLITAAVTGQLDVTTASTRIPE